MVATDPPGREKSCGAVRCATMGRVANSFPSLKGRQMLRILNEIGYLTDRTKGSHRRMVCDGRPPLTFSYHASQTIPPGVVKKTLVSDVGMSEDEALKWI